jgi:lysozyme family protein
MFVNCKGFIGVKRSIYKMAQDIVLREGGFVNEPDDPGGATNFGVTLGTLKRLGLDLNQDGAVDIVDVHLVDAKKATEVFLQHYFKAPKIDALPECLWSSVFDMYVNSEANSIRILQLIFNDLRIEVKVDGVIGPNTISAAKQAVEAAPHHIVDIYGIARRNYYFDLADKRPTLRKFARTRAGGKGGWIKRAEEFMRPK